MHRDLPRLEKLDLLARLAQGHAAGITVVTPNRRLAQFLRAEFDDTRVAAGLQAWESPDIRNRTSSSRRSRRSSGSCAITSTPIRSTSTEGAEGAARGDPQRWFSIS